MTNYNENTPNVQTPPQSLALTEGFTPVFDEIAQAHGTINALVFGVVWRYCERSKRQCFASHQTLADDLGLSRPTVHKAIKYLVEAELIIDHTPDLKHRPHTYTTSPNIVITWRIGASVGVNETTPKPEKSGTDGLGGVNDVTPGVNDVTPRCKRRDTKKQDKKEKKKQQQPIVAVDLQKEFDRLNTHLTDPIYANNRTGKLPLETTQLWAAHAEAGGDLPPTKALICMIEREQGPPTNGTAQKEVWQPVEDFEL